MNSTLLLDQLKTKRVSYPVAYFCKNEDAGIFHLIIYYCLT